MLKIICVNDGNYLGRGAEYVSILSDMVARNLPVGTAYEFICFSSNPAKIEGVTIKPLPGNLNGWWNKLFLFREGTFQPHDRIVYFDLDTVITGDLTGIINYSGNFAILRDFYRPHGLQSSVMAWRGDFGAHIWNSFQAVDFPDIEGGDQIWIEQHVVNPDIWQDMFPGQFVSYKVHAQACIPANCRVCVFHGEPRPHECAGWIPGFWRVGGFNTLDSVVGNTENDELVRNIEYSTGLDRWWADHILPHDGHAVIIGGGPSLRHELKEIKLRKENGQKIFALNNSWQWLMENGVKPDYHVMLDARAENAKFIPDFPIKQYYASQCAKEVWDLAPGAVLWNHLNAMEILKDDTRANTYIAGGSTVGLNAMSLAYILGYRKLHLYGFDSSYDDDRHHAYNQELNDKERVISVTAYDEDFTAAAWMAQQTNEFTQLLPQLLALGCVVTVHGYGLLPHVARNMSTELPRTAADLRAESILSRLEGIDSPVGVEVGVFTGALSKLLLARHDLTLYMVDSWKEHGADSEYAQTDYHGKLTQDQQDAYCENAKSVTFFAGERAKVIRKDSIVAAEDFADGSLDFVFLDADHTYDAIKADISAWLCKVKPGGWISGHDYDNPDYPAWGVKKAVEELGLPVELGLNFTWFIQLAKMTNNDIMVDKGEMNEFCTG